MTDGIMNDLAEFFLGLFVPWEKLTDTFRRHADQLNVYSNVWARSSQLLLYVTRDLVQTLSFFEGQESQLSRRQIAAIYIEMVTFLTAMSIIWIRRTLSPIPTKTIFVAPEDERFTAEILIVVHYTVTGTWGRALQRAHLYWPMSVEYRILRK